MKALTFLVGLALACVLVVGVCGNRLKRSSPFDVSIPDNSCSQGLFDIDQCSCMCNSIGNIAGPLYCFVTSIVCNAQGIPLAPGCCEGSGILDFTRPAMMGGGGGGSR